ncbi:hypothetical protein Tco_0492722 [Tanacetum coccineum]
MTSSAVYGITYWWIRRKVFYIKKPSEPTDREAVRSKMRIQNRFSRSSACDYQNINLRKGFQKSQPNDLLRRSDPTQYSEKLNASAQDRQNQSSHSILLLSKKRIYDDHPLSKAVVDRDINDPKKADGG